MLLYFLLVYSPFRRYEIFPSRDSAMFYNQFDLICKTDANGVDTACNNLMKTEAESGFRDIRRFQYLVSPAFLICIFAYLSVSSGSFSLCLVLADILRYVFKTLNPIQNDLHPLPCFQMEKNRRVTVRLLSHSRRRRFSDSESDTDYPL